jgi:hypothetical protein
MSGTLQVGGVTLATHTESPSTLTLDSGVVFPAGHVIQVTDEQDLGSANTTSTSTVAWSTTYPEVTPLVSGSKIIAVFNPGLFTDVDSDAAGNNNGRCYAERKVGDTNFSSGTTSLFSHNGNYYINIPGRGGNSSVTYFHSIFTTTSTSTIYFRLGVLKNEGLQNIYLTANSAKNTVYFVEVAQ